MTECDFYSYSGLGRRAVNQDCSEVRRLPGGGLLAVVADGMGGYSCGEVAARVVVDALVDYVEAHCATMSPEDVLTEAFPFADDCLSLRRLALGVRHMGSVAVAAIVRDGRAALAWLGDSRAYVVRQGGIVCQTEDHSVLNMLRKDGEPTAEQVRRYASAVTRCLMGADDDDVCPSVRSLALRPADQLLLCSDGLYRGADVLSLPQDDAELTHFLNQRQDQMADNYTLVRIKIKEI